MSAVCCSRNCELGFYSACLIESVLAVPSVDCKEIHSDVFGRCKGNVEGSFKFSPIAKEICLNVLMLKCLVNVL